MTQYGRIAKNAAQIFSIFLCLIFINAPLNRSAAQDGMAGQILAAHNKYRSELGIQPLAWSEELARHAQAWADHLASLGGRSLAHSTARERPGEGENLWMGTSGYFSYTAMVDNWGEEKRYYREGAFPDVSTTGSWFQVGHYTQIIWRDTREVGCAKSTAGGNDILVCRYSPPGNYMGKRAY